MIDRNVEFPNRFRMTKVEGTDDIYDLIPAPGEVIAPGDTFSKANMLPDEIVSLLGLKMANPQVKDALNVLAHVGNLHVWERVQTYADPVPEVPAGYTLGETLNKVVLYTNYNSDDAYRSITCYESLTVAKDGTISGANSSSHTIYYSRSNSTLPSSIGGKFLYENSGSTAHTNAKYTDQWWYIPTDVEILTGTGDTSDGESSTRWMGYSKLQKVTGYPYTPAIPAGTHVDYLTSTDRNAYTEGTVDNTTITYLGQLGGGARIEVGSYVGTGTYGRSNPNTLTFGLEPKAVLFWSPDNNQTIAYVYGGTTIFGFYQNYSDDRDSAMCSLSGNTLSWYSSDARCQGNRIDTTYHYIAIG